MRHTTSTTAAAQTQLTDVTDEAAECDAIDSCASTSAANSNYSFELHWSTEQAGWICKQFSRPGDIQFDIEDDEVNRAYGYTGGCQSR